jgi:peptidoglycan/xylan/chitin deacetylase (PgdA/CDA1 family)
LSGRFVISLDFELMWGVRDRRSIAQYADAIMGGRRAIIRMLELFDARRIRATWATVGLLFARSRDEMLDYAPSQLPKYDDPALSPFPFIEYGIGRDESEDPLHFGRSLVDRIKDCEGQELATHTYSHFLCLEPGASEEAFSADLRAARAIARHADVDISTIVFPRNQYAATHLRACVESGITLYRSAQPGFIYRPTNGHGNTKLIRALRLLDSVLPVSFGNISARSAQRETLTSVTASRFLRFSRDENSAYAKLHIRRVKHEMTSAAQTGAIFHLWWHPHNMGRHPDAAMAQLETLLHHFDHLQRKYGWQSGNMRDVFLGNESFVAA